jgi:agmatine/peptidylarginine deiminase
VFEQAQYTLSVVTEGGGKVTVEPLKTMYKYKDKITLEAVADAGWRFKEWQGDLTGEDKKSTIEITDNMQITAVFDRDQYSLTIEQTGEGSVLKSPDKAFYLYEDEVVLEAIPATGWIFRGWGGDISADDEKVSLTITRDHTVHALFEEPKYYLPAILSD